MPVTLTNGRQTIESEVAVVKRAGLNTNKNVNIGVTGTATPNLYVAGNVSIGGSLTTAGQTSTIISGQGATATLTAAQSGSTALFDRAAGIVYTLPAPVVGLRFTFLVTVSVTSNSDKVITDAGTTLLLGSIAEATSAGAANLYVGNGTTHISTLMNGTTTGGLAGTRLEFVCVNATQWTVNGWNNASGTIATVFSTT